MDKLLVYYRHTNKSYEWIEQQYNYNDNIYKHSNIYFQQLIYFKILNESTSKDKYFIIDQNLNYII